jgi:hypothetical protein
MAIPFPITTFLHHSCWLYLLSSTPWSGSSRLSFSFLHLLSFSFLFLLLIFVFLCFSYLFLFIYVFMFFISAFSFLPYPFISYLCFSFNLPFLHLIVASPSQAISPQSSIELLDLSPPSACLTLHQPYWLASRLLRTSQCPHLSLYKLYTKC